MAKKQRPKAPQKTAAQAPAHPPLPPASGRGGISHRAAAWLACVCGLGYFLAVGGHHAINPRNIDWLMRNDWSQHYLGWAFFRHAPWQWPLGTITALGHPVGTTVALTDANPLLALLLRPIAPWLPDPVQYIGPYMALCMALQGYVGARLTAPLGGTPITAFWGGCLYVLTPALLHRMDHDTLMGHWLILTSIALVLWQPHAAVKNRWLALVLGTAVLAALIHPYLLAMALPMLLVAVGQHVGPKGLLSKAEAAVFLGVMACALGVIAWALGYLQGQANWGTDGFGFFSADLTAFVSPRGWSRVMPDIKAHRGQAYEGFGYLGLGLLMLCALGARAALQQKLGFANRRRGWALVAVALACLAFAFGPSICWQGRQVTDLWLLYRPFERVCAMFRASGRFVWVPSYLAMTAALGALIARGRATGRAQHLHLSLALLVVLQLLDARPQQVYERLTQDPHVAMVDPVWQKLSHDYDHVVLVPPHFPTSHVLCNPKGYREKIEMPPGLLAASLGMTVNSAYLSRSDAGAIASYCNRLGASLQGGAIDGRSVYLVHPDFLPLLTGSAATSGALGAGAAAGRSNRPPVACFRADGYIGCVRADRPTPFLTALGAAHSILP